MREGLKYVWMTWRGRATAAGRYRESGVIHVLRDGPPPLPQLQERAGDQLGGGRRALGTGWTVLATSSNAFRTLVS